MNFSVGQNQPFGVLAGANIKPFFYSRNIFQIYFENIFQNNHRTTFPGRKDINLLDYLEKN
ncbi:hypothetical protein, partial [Winogradskyella alexanderae]